MDIQTLRRLLYDFYKFSQDFTVQACGTGYLIGVRRGTGAAGEVAIPFAVLKVDDTTIRVRYGSVTTPDGNFVPPSFNPGDSPPFTLSVSGNGVVFIYMTTDATTGEITAVSDPDTDTALPPNTSTEQYLQIGSFTTDGGGILSVQSENVGSLAFEMCGGSAPIWGAV